MKWLLKFSHRHVSILQLLLDFALVIITGIYVSKVVGIPISFFDHPINFFGEANHANWFLVAGLLIVVMKHKLSKNVSAEEKKAVVRKLLEGIVKTLTLSMVDSSLRVAGGPAEKSRTRSSARSRDGSHTHEQSDSQPQSELEIRAFCHLYNEKKKELYTYCAWGYQWNEDFDSTVPCNHPNSDKFIIVRAFQQRKPFAEDVGLDGVVGMPVPVWPELKCVLAAPIRDFNDPLCQPLGTINFDSNRTLEEAHFKGKRAEEICLLYASSIYDLLKD